MKKFKNPNTISRSLHTVQSHLNPKFILSPIIILTSKLLEYKETNWKFQRGYKTRKYNLVIDTILASKTMKEQQTKIEKISLVAFLNREQRKFFINICRRLKRNNKHFYQNKNLYATLLAFITFCPLSLSELFIKLVSTLFGIITSCKFTLSII